MMMTMVFRASKKQICNLQAVNMKYVYISVKLELRLQEQNSSPLVKVKAKP